MNVRIGEILLGRVNVPPDELARALEEQARNGGRLCSLLISRGAIDFDVGARALGDQKGVPCALAKHLANRDNSVAQLISPELGRRWCALPIGRTSGGALIVAVRDPDPELQAALESATGSEIGMVITPATRLERLIAVVYGATPDDFEIDLDSRVDVPTLAPAGSPSSRSSPNLAPLTSSSQNLAPLSSSSQNLAPLSSSSQNLTPLSRSSPNLPAASPVATPRTLSRSGLAAASSPAPIHPSSSGLAAASNAAPPSSSSSGLVAGSSLPSSSSSSSGLAAASNRAPISPSSLAAASSLLPPNLPPMPDLDMLNPDTLRLALSPLDDTRVAREPEQGGAMIAAMQNRQRGVLPPAAPTISASRTALGRSESRDAATDAAMAFVAGRWRSAALVAVRGASAIGYRGHGVASIADLELPLDDNSTIGRVVASKQVLTAVLAAGALDPLGRALNMPATLAAAPVLVGGDVIAVIAVGDSIHGIADTAAVDELGVLAIALGDAYERIRNLGS